MGKIIDLLNARNILVSDGAWGTFIHQKGLQPDACPESWNLERPGAIYEIALSYVEAGADLILTNSFGGNPFKLMPYGLDGRVYEINRAASEISRRAAGDSVLVLGSVGPTGKMLMMGEVTEEELFNGFTEQIRGLCDGGADAILIETMSDLEEARVAVRAAKQVAKLEVICTFTFTLTPAKEYRTMMGISPVEAVEMLIAEGADIVGANCGNGTAGMIEIVKEIRSVYTNIPVLVHANAGLPVLIDGITVFPETPEEMAPQMRDLVKAGADIVGGCCGTTPEHIRRIVEMVK
ncbi:MAG: homocysteine S-methyltransferase family protein [Bacteroidales bacterium]|nr:homocysteine S-methyltransferase family protein [Bacteroidales bacterium]